jgi:hypothetical protein
MSNLYLVDGTTIVAAGCEYSAVKKAYQMADRVEMVRYAPQYPNIEAWEYKAIFPHGSAKVTVARLYQMERAFWSGADPINYSIWR